jgi:hypothetical protein
MFLRFVVFYCFIRAIDRLVLLGNDKYIVSERNKNRMKSILMGKISFWLAVSSRLSAGAQFVGLPDFG